MGYVLAPQMRIGVPKETAAGEQRVGLVPEVVGKLKAKDVDVLVESGAGEGALLTDDAYVAAGAEIARDRAAVWACDVVVTIAPPDGASIALLKPESILIGFLAPLTSPATTRAPAMRAGATTVLAAMRAAGARTSASGCGCGPTTPTG